MGAKSTQNAASKAGSKKHFAKAATQASQLKSDGAMTGGFATSPGTPAVKTGKFLSKGKP